MSQHPKPGRIACEVPFCRRTAKDDGAEGQQIICGKHWRLADRSLTRRYRKWQRRADDLMSLPPERYTAADQQKVVRVFNLVRKMWDRIRRQAIERAVGIS